MSNEYKYHAIIFGRNATVYWKTALEALIWKTIYNLCHSIKRDGRCITKIHKVQYVHKSNLSTRQEPQYFDRKQENRHKPNT